MHMQQHVKCLSEFFEVTVINQDCDYRQICDKYQPDLTLFESGVKYTGSRRLNIKNTSAYPEIPKLGFHNGDPWCDCRAGFLSDMERWDIEIFFSIGNTLAERTPEIAENLFVWPNFIDTDIYRDYGQTKIIPVLVNGNVGSLYPWRQKINKVITQYYPSLICPHLGYENRSEWRMLHGEQYARTINASWFVPTCGTVTRDIVRKHFEIPASKSCLLTERSPALEAAGFIDMKNCIFADENDVLDKLSYLFKNINELERIIHAGYQLVHSKHTLKQRDQIFQWFNLYKNLKPNQKIVQTNPFAPLTITEKLPEIKNSHIISQGLDLVLLQQGDENLWSGKYEEAEVLYLKCLNYIPWMPEPKLRLTLCNLYKGNAKTALDWILQPTQYTLEVYNAFDPDPVEWAYCIISLLCLGKLAEAVKQAKQFPSLSHPELNRTRWAIDFLASGGNIAPLLHNEQLKHRYSIHQLPNRSFKEWIEHLCIMLNSCQQFTLAAMLSEYINPEFRSLPMRENAIDKTTELSAKQAPNPGIHGFRLNIFSKILYTLNPYPFRNRVIVRFRRKIKLKTRLLPFIQSLQVWLRRFLPYYSQVSNDEFFHKVEKLAREENIKTALIIGASVKESTELFLKGIKENPNKPTVFCVNVPKAIAELQKQYANKNFVKFFEIPDASSEDLSDEIENEITRIKQETRVKCFDIVLIDGSELNFSAELNEELSGVSFFLLDDINTFHNQKNHYQLLTHPDYILDIQDPCFRNGYAIFKKVERYCNYVLTSSNVTVSD